MGKTHFYDEDTAWCGKGLTAKDFVSTEPAHVDCMSCLKERLRRIKAKEYPYQNGVFCDNCNTYHEFNGECA